MTNNDNERERERETRILSMFTGIGGFELAFNIRGFKTIWGNEIDKFAAQTFRDNFPHINLIEGDIREIPAEQLPQHDILVGGFPCQPWSTAQQGTEQGLNDKRGWLFKEIIRVLEYHKPPYFLLENVKGLISKKNKEAFNLIISELERLNYKVSYKVLNAKHYGVPQNRERVFIIGNLYGLNFEWPEPSNKPVKITDILEQGEVDAKYYLSEKGWLSMLNREWKHSGSNKRTFNFLEKYGDRDDLLTFTTKYNKHTLSEPLNKEGISNAIISTSSNIPYIYQRRFKKIIENTENCPTLLANPGGTGYPVIFQNRRGSIRENKENISPTLTGNMGQGGNNQPFIFRTQFGKNEALKEYPTLKAHAGGSTPHLLIENRPRKLTPRECLRLQGFPEWFNIIVSDNQIYKQIGNAIAVPVVEAIAKEIYKQWINKEKNA